MGIRETLGMGAPASWTYVGDYLRDQYIRSQAGIARRDEAKKRDAYYEGGGDEHIKRFIMLAFEDTLVRKLRSDLVGQAKWNNVLRRVASELATVYSEPASRKVADDEKYQAFLEEIDTDTVMREVDQKLVIHNDVWVQYRVRKDTKEPVIDVVTPAMFWAVCHPQDQTQLIAIVLDQTPARVTRVTPCYRVWTADETFTLDSECRVIVSSVEPNSLARMPGVLVSARPATAKGQLLDDSPAADLCAAHECIWFQNVLLIKESKSANKATYVSGDVSSAATGQSADTERETILPEGVTVQGLDRGMDLKQFRENADHVLERAAANHGLPPSVLHQSDASSGAEIHLRRIPLRELRRKRIPIMRRLEKRLAEIQSAVNANDLQEFAFSTEGWGIDFGEVQQPLTEMEADQVFEKRRQLGLTNTIAEIRKRNPDLTDDKAALDVLDANIKAETLRIAKMKEMLAMSGSMGASTEDMNAGGKKPFEANRGKPDDDDEGGAAPAAAVA
jgi:hypothetical protein